MDAMDFCSFYFVFTRARFKVSAFPLIVSFLVTIVDDVAKLGPFYDSLIAGYIAYRIGKSICVGGLVDKLQENIEKLGHMRCFAIRLRVGSDDDVIGKLESAGNKTDYIRRLIREDIRK